MRFSVVVCTYNRVDGLKRTLDALRYQTHGDFEVVVVNGPSTDGTAEMLAGIEDVRVVDCSVARLSVSRNLGIAATAGEVVAFIDDDAIPESNWLSDLDAAYGDGIGGAGGIVFNHTGVELQYRYAVHGRTGNPDFLQKRPLDRFVKPGSDPLLYLQGTNMSFRRSVLAEIGGFDEGIEYNHDDVEICLQVIDRGYQIEAVDGAGVHHRYLASHMRNARRWVFDPYKPMKDRAYFALMHGRPARSTRQVIREVEQYADWVRRGAREDCKRGVCSQQELEYFLSRVDEALQAGVKHGLDGQRLGVVVPPPSPDFKHFRALRPSEGRTTVCLVSFEYPPADFGGVGRYTADLAAGLAERGHEVHVFTRSADWPRVDFEDGVWLHRTVTHGSVLKELSGHPLASNLYLLASDYHEIDTLCQRIPVDIVFAPFWLCEGGFCQLDSRFATVSTLQTVHKTIAKILKSWEGNPHIEGMVKLEEATVRRARYLHANSQASLDTVRADFDIESAEARVVPHGLRDQLPEYPIPPPDPDRVNLLFVGRLERRKGADVLLEIAPELLEEFPYLHITMAGKDTPSTDMPMTYRESFEAAMADKPELAKRVTFTGFLPDDDLYRHYAACDIVCAPSRYESFGLVLLEAMMFGKPVVGCAAGGMVEVVEDGVNGFLAAPGDARSLSACLRQLIADPALRERFGQSARDRFERIFRMDLVAKRMIETFQDAILDARSQREEGRANLAPAASVREGATEIIMEAVGMTREAAEAAASALLDWPELRSPFVAAIRAIWPKPPEVFVMELYRLLLGRDADSEGLAYYADSLRHGTPRAAVVRIMATSAEGWGFLGEASWLKALELFELEDHRAAIETLWPAPASVFVRGLYQRLLHREPDLRGWLTYMARLRSGQSRLDTVRSVTNSIETKSKGVVPNLGLELSDRIDRAQEDPRAAQIREAISGGDQRFVEVAYRTILSREPDPDGLNRAMKRLRLGVRRGQVLADLARSDEAISQAIDTGFLLGIEGPRPTAMEIVLGGSMAMVRRILPRRARVKARAASRWLTRAVALAGGIPGLGGTRRQLRSREGDSDGSRLPDPRIRDAVSYAAKLAEFNGNIKLNLGSGPRPLPGYINIDYRDGSDVDVVADVRRLPYEPGTVHEIFSAHLIEHLKENDLAKVILPYWHELLQPGGTLRIVCPNWEASLRRHQAGGLTFAEMKEVTFDGQEDHGNDQFATYSPETLRKLLEQAGFTQIEMLVADRTNVLSNEMEFVARA